MKVAGLTKELPLRPPDSRHLAELARVFQDGFLEHPLYLGCLGDVLEIFQVDVFVLDAQDGFQRYKFLFVCLLLRILVCIGQEFVYQIG